jgi:hypothetical protein
VAVITMNEKDKFEYKQLIRWLDSLGPATTALVNAWLDNGIPNSRSEQKNLILLAKGYDRINAKIKKGKKP